MGIVLQILKIYIIGFFCSLVVISTLYGQIPIKNSQSTEVSFTMGESRSLANTESLGLSDSRIGAFISSTEDEIHRFTYNTDSDNLFYVQASSGIGIGKYYQNREDEELFGTSFINSSSEQFDAVSFAFDFIFIPEDGSNHSEFQLSYRVNNGFWKSPSEGVFTSDMLRSDDLGWNSFSIQIMINDLFLNPNDIIEVRWNRINGSQNQFIPIALQRVELYPNVFKPEKIHPGSLIITELLPTVNIKNSSVEYIEIYNPTNFAVKLKGLTIQSGENFHTIQKDIQVNPYQTFVMGTRSGIKEIEDHISYFYPTSILSSSLEEVKITMHEKEISLARYERTEPGIALELDHLKNAYDGYSNRQNFSVSENRIAQDLMGSPGTISPEKKFYSKELTDEWNFLYAPGNLSKELNRDGYFQFYALQNDLSAELVSGIDQQFGQPFVLRANGNTGNRIYSEGDLRQIAPSFLKTDSNLILTGNPLSTPITAAHFVDNMGNRAFPIVKYWNRDLQRFSLSYNDDLSIPPWTGIIGNSASDVSFVTAENELFATRGRITRSISFRLSENNHSDRLISESVIGFMGTDNENVDSNQNLPAFWPLQIHSGEETVPPFIFLESASSNFSSNSFLQYPLDLESPIVINLHTFISNANSGYRLHWGEMNDIPNDWILEFRDHQNNVTLNMREESSYSITTGTVELDDDLRKEFSAFQLIKRDHSTERFTVKISPYAEEKEVEVDSRPETVNLRQNYPNPFNPTTTISFYLPKTQNIRLAIYNVVGQQVDLLRDERLAEGEHSIIWNASEMPSGVYIVQLEAGGANVFSRKITLIK